MAYLGAPDDDAAAVHCHGIATAVVAGAGCFPLLLLLVILVSVRLLFISHSGYFVSQNGLYRVLIALRVYRVVYQLIFVLDLF